VTLQIDESRPYLAGFGIFYQTEIARWMADRIERHRRAKRHALLVALGGAAALALLIWLNFAADIHLEELSAELAFALPILLAMGIGYLALRPLRNLHGEIKAFLLGKVCGFLGLRYSATPAAFPFANFDDIGLLPGHHRRRLEDNIDGSHDGVDFTLCEARLQQRRTDSKGRTTYVEVYHGILFQLTFPKRFAGRTLVTRDGGTIGNFFRGIGKQERVTLEDTRFEKLFEVYSDDQVEARYLMTPTFMERVTALADSFGRKSVELAFVDDHLLVSIRVSSDQFEGGGMFRAMDDTQRIESLIAEICKIYDVIDTLQLNIKTNL
jgi:hypothetical protein